MNFKWGLPEKRSFNAITEAICDNTLLSYFDTKKQTALFTDASPVDHLEREALAMHFGCTRFRIFLQGCHFTHFIDPEPLKHMMEKSNEKLRRASNASV